MAYWLAPALVTLRAEVNALRPERDRTSDGWIGDKAHAGGKSDHNPSNWPGSWSGVVRAFDFDNDLGGGLDGLTLWDLLVPQLGKHPALGADAYLIFRGRIISTDRLDEGARPYSGKNPHEGHIHVSVATSPAGYNSGAGFGVMEGLIMAAVDADRLNKAVDRILGTIPDRRNPDGTVATVMLTDSGQVLRDDIVASTARTVAEVSAAFHQLVALVDGIEGAEVDVDALAGALRTGLGDALADSLAARLVRPAA